MIWEVIAWLILCGAVIRIHDEVESLRMNVNALSMAVREKQNKEEVR